MSLSVVDVVTQAYYLTGVLSTANGAIIPTLSTNQKTLGIDQLNLVLNGLYLNPNFGGFMKQYSVNAQTEQIYIGRDLTPSDSITIFDADPFKWVYGANFVYNTVSQPLNVFNYEYLGQNSELIIQGQPWNCYVTTMVDDLQNMYNSILLLPSPNQTYQFNFYGIPHILANQTELNSIIPSLPRYLTYKLARALCAIFQREDSWTQMKETELQQLESIVMVGRSSPTPNANSWILGPPLDYWPTKL